VLRAAAALTTTISPAGAPLCLLSPVRGGAGSLLDGLGSKRTCQFKANRICQPWHTGDCLFNLCFVPRLLGLQRRIVHLMHCSNLAGVPNATRSLELSCHLCMLRVVLGCPGPLQQGIHACSCVVSLGYDAGHQPGCHGAFRNISQDGERRLSDHALPACAWATRCGHSS
jgi:hypothetical protein